MSFDSHILNTIIAIGYNYMPFLEQSSSKIAQLNFSFKITTSQ